MRDPALHILFATHRTHEPEATGGAQRSMHALLARVSERHRCTVVCSSSRGPRLLAFRVARRASQRRLQGWRDRRAGYPVYRTCDYLVPALLEAMLARKRPDVVVADLGSPPLLQVLREHRVPALIRVVDALFGKGDLPLDTDRSMQAYANSEFVSERLRQHGTRSAGVVYPIVEASGYRVERGSPERITFVNPRPVKGLQLVLDIARRLPHRRFCFVESWPLPAAAKRDLTRTLAALPNVELAGPVADVRHLYRETRLLLVPSQCEEAFGRVVLEAQASGIPVVARAIGGLPESVGEGGILLPADADAVAWAAALERTMSDESFYGALSAAALANVRRPEFSPAVITQRFLSLVEAQAAGVM